MTTPADPTPAALAALDLTPKGIGCDTDETEPRFWRCMCCEFCTDSQPAISAHYITTGHGYLADNAYADLLDLLAAARQGEEDTTLTAVRAWFDAWADWPTTMSRDEAARLPEWDAMIDALGYDRDERRSAARAASQPEEVSRGE